MDDGPNIFMQLLMPAGVACNGKQPAATVTLSMTGALLTGGAIVPQIHPVGQAAAPAPAAGNAGAGQAATPAPATATPAPTPAPATGTLPTGDAGVCFVTLPKNALSATGLSTPWLVSGNGCTQTADGAPTFAECTIVDPTNNKLFVYSPLLINQGQAFVQPVVPTLPANSVVGCWFGTNGDTTVLADTTNGADLAAANCVNGDPKTKGDLFGQFAACNAAQFFAAANKANLAIPALGTGKNGKPCYTTRSFEVVDMDQSDNVITTYSLDNNGKIGQKTTANSKTLTNDINNGSDNLLLDLFMRPALGCTAFVAPSLADPAMSFGSLALNELQAAKLQAAPVATVPPNNPMVTLNGAFSLTKQNAYRAAANMAAGAGTTAEATAYCQNFLDVTATSIITDAKFTIGFMSPDTGAGVDLYTFLGQRHAASWTGLGCDTLLTKVVYLDAAQKLPIITNTNADGVTTSLTFNTATLLAAAQKAGLVMNTPAPAAGNGNGGAATPAPATPAPATPAPTPAAGAAPVYDFAYEFAACYPSGNGQNIFQVNIKASVNGEQPAADANGGLAALTITFNGLASIGIANTGSIVNPTTSGNKLMFQTMDDGPQIFLQLLMPAGVACNGKQPAATVTLSMTGALLTGGAIVPQIHPVGQAAAPATPAPTPAAGNGAVTPTPAPATPAPAPATPAPVPAAGGAPVYDFAYEFAACYPSGNGQNIFQINIKASVNGEQPAADANGGLAALTITFGGLASVGIANTGGIVNPTTAGNKLMFQTQDDGPNIMLQMLAPAGVACNGKQPAATLTLSMTGALLTGGAIVPQIHPVGQAAAPAAGQGATVPVPTPAPVPAPTPAPAPATPAPAAGNGGAVPYAISLRTGNCWGTNPVNFIVGTTIAVNGNDTPAGDRNGGLAALKLVFNDLKDITISSTWNFGVPKTTGNALTFETLDDQPGPGGIFQTNSATCVNGVMSPQIKSVTFTGQLVSGGAIAPTISVGQQ
ncbi:hypothetical protein HDU93_009048 [Gonapodya sp. JEL0774]|nr:hypothetical protein HDU93_009048 [Gonapodya sp. JEL0774]